MPSPESEQLRAMLKQQQAMASQVPFDLTVQRQQMERMGQQVPLAPDVQVEPVVIEGLHAEWVSTPGAVQDKVWLYLHGGGYVMGSCATCRELASRLARVTGLRLLTLEYRLAPEYPFPAALDDAIIAYQWLLASGFTPEQIMIGGESAGGGLAVATLVALRDVGVALPTLAVLLSPFIDMEGTGDSVTSRAAFDPMLSAEAFKGNGGPAAPYIGNADPRNPLISPLYADVHGLPPLFIQVGRDEILLDDSTRLAERAKAAGVDVTLQIWDDMWHVFQSMAAMLPEGQQAIEQIGNFVRSRMHLPAPASTAAD